MNGTKAFFNQTTFNKLIFIRSQLTWNWLTALPLLFAVASVLHFDVFYYSHDTPKWLLIDTVLALFVFCKLKWRILSLGWIGIVTSTFVYLMLASVLWAPNIYMSLEFCLRFTLFLLVLITLQQNYSSKQIVNLLMNSCFVSAVAFSAMFILERISNVPYNTGSYTPIGFINNAGHVFNIWIPCLILLLIRNWRTPRYCLLLSFSILTIVTVLMMSAIRSTIFALIISELILFLIVFFKNKKQALLFLSISTLLMVGITTFKYSDHLADGRLSAKLKAVQNNLSGSYQARLNMLQNSKLMTLENPFGVGINNFEYIHPKYASMNSESKSPMVGHNTVLKTPHNFIAKITTELGFIGGTIIFILLLYYWLSALSLAWRGELADRWLFVALTATLIHAQTSAVFLTPLSFLFSLLLFSAIHARKIESKKTRRVIQFRIPAQVQSYVLIIPMLSLTYTVSEFYAFKGTKQSDPSLLKKAVAINPGNDRAWLQLSLLNSYRMNDQESSLVSINKFLKLNPEHLFGQYFKAQLLIKMNQFDKADALLIRVLEKHVNYQQAIELLEESNKIRRNYS